jgi:hypothetical protein
LRKQECAKNTQKKAQQEHTCKKKKNKTKQKSCSIKTLREHAPKKHKQSSKRSMAHNKNMSLHTTMVNNIRTPRKKA